MSHNRPREGLVFTTLRWFTFWLSAAAAMISFLSRPTENGSTLPPPSASASASLHCRLSSLSPLFTDTRQTLDKHSYTLSASISIFFLDLFILVWFDYRYRFILVLSFRLFFSIWLRINWIIRQNHKEIQSRQRKRNQSQENVSSIRRPTRPSRNVRNESNQIGSDRNRIAGVVQA